VSKNLGWRWAIVIILIVVAFLYLTPSISKELPPWWSSVLPQEKIQLGLDLQGGMHLTLEVDVLKAVENDLERAVEDIKEDLRQEKIRYLELKRNGMNGISLTLMRGEDRDAVANIIKARYPDYTIVDGAPVEEGVALSLNLNPEAETQIKKMATEQALETIRNRIDQFGVSEPEISTQEGYRIFLQLPGITDLERAMNLIGKTAQLEFKLVDEDNSLDEAMNGNMPTGDEILYNTSVDMKTGRQVKQPYLVKERASLTGEYITDAKVNFNQYNEPYVALSFDNKGARTFERITGENVGKRLAIVLDNSVYSAPVINDKISGGRAQITGRFSMDEAKDLSIVLRAGALPAPVKILEERSVGPSLGQDSIDKGLKSAIIGGVLVVLFMILYYGFSGVIADIALLLNMLFIMAGLAFFGGTLTLPGIAGIILTLGMAVDANVLIYERIREEIRQGKTIRAAIEAGYEKAFVTIFDSNVTTLFAALVLFQFGTGPIRGFAVTLTIGIMASFITAVFVTRVFFDYLYIQRNWKRISI
jgi:preprotein translocase subunit SecD